MCLVRIITYVHPDNRRENQQQVRRCSQAPTGTLCPHVEYQKAGEARVVEVQPSSNFSSSHSKVTSADPRFFPFSKRASRRTSKERSPRKVDSKHTSMETPPSPSRSRPTYKTFAPRAPSPPSPLARAHQKHVSFDESADTNRTLSADGTAVYSRPPSFNMPRATTSERTPSDRRSSISSLTNEIDDTEPPQHRASTKHSRRATITDFRPDFDTSPASLPGLSNLPRIDHSRQNSTADLPPPNPRASMSREEYDRQARKLKAHLEDAEKRQRKHSSRDSSNNSRSQETSRERRDRHRRNAEATLCGQNGPDHSPKPTEERERRLAAEMAQATRRDRTSWVGTRKQLEEPRPSSISAAQLQAQRASSTKPTSSPSRNVYSARTYAESIPAPTTEIRTPRYSVQVHHYPQQVDPVARRGEAAISRSRDSGGRLSGAELEEMVGGINLRDSVHGWGKKAARDSGISFSPVSFSPVREGEGKKYRKEQKRRSEDRG